MQLYHDIPYCQGVENALKRAKQLAGLTYTPVLPLPIVDKLRGPSGERADSMNVETHWPAWLPAKGVLYSSVRRYETYVGYNISPETFVTALSNPHSVMYTKPIQGTGQNVHNHYGIVCSCYVSYCLNLHYRTNCARWPSLPGIHEVDTSRLENIQLADVVLNAKYHIAIVTDIERDVDGNVHYISVSESTLPLVRTTRFTPEEFRGYWLQNDYIVYRYDGVKDVPYTPDPFAPIPGDPDMPEPFINRSLMPDYGNKANYRLGEEPVELSVFEPDCREVEITGPDGDTFRIPVEGGFARVLPEKTGVYRAACVLGDGLSPAVEWCVTDLVITPEKTAYSFGETVNLQYRNATEDPILGWVYVRHDIHKGSGSGWLDLRKEGAVTIPGPTAAGEMELILVARNAFGCYSSRRVVLSFTEEAR